MKTEKISSENVNANAVNPLLPAVLIGYIILENAKFKVSRNNDWQEMETGFDIEYKKKIYPRKESAIESVKQMKKNYKNNEFEIHPVYWYGR